MKLASNDHSGKRVNGKDGGQHLHLTLALINHLCMKSGDNDVYLKFLDTVDTLIGKITKNLKVIIGADVNSNIGTSTNSWH